MLFHLWGVVDQKVEQITTLNKQGFILRRQMNGCAQEQE
jgi:hypothetical protein